MSNFKELRTKIHYLGLGQDSEEVEVEEKAIESEDYPSESVDSEEYAYDADESEDYQ